MNEVNQHLRTGYWRLAGGISTGMVKVTPTESKLFYFQAIILKTAS